MIPLRGKAEIAAVDAGRTHGGLQGGLRSAPCGDADARGRAEARLDDDQREREGDQDRDDGVERAREGRVSSRAAPARAP